MKVRRYGLWLIPKPITFEHRDIYRQTRVGYSAPTPFQRTIGVRYSHGTPPRFPDSQGGFAGFGLPGAPASVSKLLKGFFAPGHVHRNKVKLLSGHATALAKASGYIILAAPHLRMRSMPGRAQLIASLRINSSKNA